MDLSFLKGKEKKIDELTQVYERGVITSYADHLIQKKIPFVFAILDVDNFKFINDNYGHLTGDEVLQTVAKSLKELVKDKGVVGRYGGDEFIFVFPNITEYDDTWKLGYDLIKSPPSLVFKSVSNLSISYTLGMSRFPLNTSNLDDLFTLADKALYRGKMKGRNCFIIYLPEKHKDINLLSKRDKVYTTMYISNKLFQMLTNTDNVEKAIADSLAFIGSILMLEHVCIETKDRLRFEYVHPLGKREEGYFPFGYDAIQEKLDIQGICYNNVTYRAYEKQKCQLFKEFDEQKIYSSFLAAIQVYDKLYGYLRVDMVATNTGRLWQQNDLVLLSTLSNLIALVLYTKNKEL